MHLPASQLACVPMYECVRMSIVWACASVSVCQSVKQCRVQLEGKLAYRERACLLGSQGATSTAGFQSLRTRPRSDGLPQIKTNTAR